MPGCRHPLPTPDARKYMTVTATDLLLEATDISKTYGAVVALRSASLRIRPGEVHALMGANGAGKSTLVKILTGAVRPDTGAIAVRGRERVVHSPLEARRGGARLGLPGAGADPGPGHPVQPASHGDAARAVPALARRARTSRPGPVGDRPACAARLAPDRRPCARPRHRARRPHARRDVGGPAGRPHGTRPRGRSAVCAAANARSSSSPTA